MPKGDYLKYTEESIKQRLIENDITILEGEYQNRNSEIVVQDSKGYRAIITFGALMKGTKISYFRKINPYTIENIKLWCTLNNYPHKYVRGEYLSNNTKLTFLCKTHGEFEISWNKVLHFRKCAKCANNIKYTLEDIKEKMLIINPNTEIISTEYLGANEPLRCRCKIDNHEWTTTWHGLAKSKGGCTVCQRRNFSGEGNVRWNPNLTDREREYRRNIRGYKEWIKKVYTRDRFTCKNCSSSKSGTLIAHHLNGYDCFKDERLDVDNGITLCETCHKDFHSTYGYGKNTKEQFLKWYDNNLYANHVPS